MKIDIMGIPFNNIDKFELINLLSKQVKLGEQTQLNTINVDFINRAFEDTNFNSILLKETNINIADGMPIIWMSKLLRKPLKERITGADLLPLICKESLNNNFRIFLLGSDEKTLESAVRNLRNLYPTCNIVGSFSPPFGSFDYRTNNNIINQINISNANILFVAFGSPKQELWINENLSSLINVKIAIGCGATIDFAGGKIRRAPKRIQRVGLEWFFRLLQEPSRMWKRYIIKGPKIVFHFLDYYLLKMMKFRG